MKYINNINIEKIKSSFNDPKKPYRYVVIDDFLIYKHVINFQNPILIQMIIDGIDLEILFMVKIMFLKKV